MFRYLKKVGTPESKRNTIMFMLLLDTGMRIGELLNVQVDDIDFHNNTIHAKKQRLNHKGMCFSQLILQQY